MKRLREPGSNDSRIDRYMYTVAGLGRVEAGQSAAWILYKAGAVDLRGRLMNDDTSPPFCDNISKRSPCDSQQTPGQPMKALIGCGSSRCK